MNEAIMVVSTMLPEPTTVGELALALGCISLVFIAVLGAIAWFDRDRRPF